MEIFKVYIIKCKDGSLYTGYTNCFTTRFNDHLTTAKGAKYIKAKGLDDLVYIDFFNSKSQAMKEEFRIKSLTRKQKLMLIDKGQD